MVIVFLFLFLQKSVHHNCTAMVQLWLLLEWSAGLWRNEGRSWQYREIWAYFQKIEPDDLQMYSREKRNTTDISGWSIYFVWKLKFCYRLVVSTPDAVALLLSLWLSRVFRNLSLILMAFFFFIVDLAFLLIIKQIKDGHSPQLSYCSFFRV